jgi:lipid-A-disaccharide synthase-like uncharacterized protein
MARSQDVYQLLGFLGAIVVAAGYLPQIVRIAREGCSAGVSVHAWATWLVASLLILLHALAIGDPVFVSLQAVNVTAIISIIALAKHYERMTCKTHQRGTGQGTSPSRAI